MKGLESRKVAKILRESKACGCNIKKLGGGVGKCIKQLRRNGWGEISSIRQLIYGVGQKRESEYYLRQEKEEQGLG